jgi:CRP/FNR family transcriptional regulator, cyclic AMP receptor protein
VRRRSDKNGIAGENQRRSNPRCQGFSISTTVELGYTDLKTHKSPGASLIGEFDFVLRIRVDPRLSVVSIFFRFLHPTAAKNVEAEPIQVERVTRMGGILDNMNPFTATISKDEPKAAQSLEAAIAGHPFLKGLSSEHLKILADSAMFADFSEGQLIFSQRDPANRFYLLKEGHVVLESHVRDSGTVPIQTIGPGDVLGWSWLFPPYHWHFDARALEPTKAIFFYGTRLREHCEQNHDLGYELMKRMTEIVIKRLQATWRQLLDSEGLLPTDARE